MHLRRCIGAAALAFLLVPVMRAEERPLASTQRFSFDLGYTQLDGAELHMVILRSRTVSLTTDSVRAWIPLDEPVDSAGFSFRHERDLQSHLHIYALAPEWASESDAVWERFVASMKQRLGEGTAVSGVLDSAKGPPALKLFGWRTREAVFMNPQSARGEHHVLVTNGRVALLFQLTAPSGRLAEHAAPFRQFVAHLSLL